MPLNSEALALWLQTHVTGKDYVAHAIWADNVELTLKEGRLRPAEEVLRRTHVVSYEKGNSKGSRGQVRISQEQITQLEKTPDLPKIVAIKTADKLPLKEAFDYLSESILSPVYLEYSKTTQISIHGKSHGFSGSKNFFDCEISSLPVVEIDWLMKSSYEDELEKQRKQFPNLSHHTLQVFLDRKRASNSESIDQRLSNIWDTYTSPNETEDDYSRLAMRLHEARKQEIQVSKMNATIRTLYNGIAWGYGDVVVVRGNPRDVLSWVNRANIKEGSNRIRKYSEVSLLYPFENKGNFFSLDLSDPNVILLGPKKTLMAYEGKGFQLCYFEEMSDEHLNFFEVPLELRLTPCIAKESQAIEKSPLASALKTAQEEKQQPACTTALKVSKSGLSYFPVPKHPSMETFGSKLSQPSFSLTLANQEEG